MASIFEQYQSTLAKEVPVNVPETSGLGYVSIPKEHLPMFKKQKLNLKLENEILYVCIANNCLVALMSDQFIFKLNLSKPDEQQHIKLDHYIRKHQVTGMYLDPWGLHTVLTLGPPKGQAQAGIPGLLYCTSKAKILTRFKDIQITAIAWNWDNKQDSSTGWVLLGNNKGQIFEAELSAEGEKQIKPIFEVGEGANERKAITGIRFFRAPGTNNYIVIVTTVDRLYKFHETTKFDSKMSAAQQIFTPYLNIREDLMDFHQMVTKGLSSRLEYLVEKEFPKSFGFLTDAGVLYLSVIDRIASSPQFVGPMELIPIPEEEEERPINSHRVESRRQHPKSLVLTDYHVILLFQDHLKAISTLNYQPVYEEYFTENHGRLLDLVKDPISGSVYLYTTQGIYLYRISNEHRNVWRLYLEKNEFGEALKHCRENQAYKDIVLTKQAEVHFSKKEFMKAAQIFSDTQRSFEEVCLKFYEINENEALLCYLKNRLDKLKPTDKTQITMLTIWIIELYLTEMSKHPSFSRKFKDLHDELDKMMKLQRVTECIRNNRSVVQELIASHGDIYDLTALKSVNQNIDSLVTQFINQENFTEAINTLKTCNKPELIYKYGPILMEELPSETNVMLKRLGKRLDAVKLIPSMTSINSDKHIAEIIDYLEFSIHNLGNTEQSLNNYLILLYAKHRKTKLVSYLESQGKDKSLINYDIYFALRTAKEHDVNDACVHLYCMLDLWQKAVELALKYDNEKLAQQTASDVQDTKLRKQLWLLIAKHQIKAKNNVADALKLLNECDLLRLEDILPFFSEFQKIDDFKDTVCAALKEYEYKLQAQKRDMEESIEAAEKVRNNLQSFRNRSIVISGSDVCTICEIHLMIKPFFLFPCGHKFHSDCMEKQIIAADEEKQARLNALKYQLMSCKGTDAEKSREQIKEEMKDVLASQCFYCGDTMIDVLDQRFDTNWEEL